MWRRGKKRLQKWRKANKVSIGSEKGMMCYGLVSRHLFFFIKKLNILYLYTYRINCEGGFINNMVELFGQSVRQRFLNGKRMSQTLVPAKILYLCRFDFFGKLTLISSCGLTHHAFFTVWNQIQLCRFSQSPWITLQALSLCCLPVLVSPLMSKCTRGCNPHLTFTVSLMPLARNVARISLSALLLNPHRNW